ncbi:hypothetical protein FE257_005421 [Aspergillus nanangensis]|uniref:GPI anchored protein n=1 Tax=Aspergillus nanangensis TaxID=2582783 RepID=A0AAD4CQJ4_ASPNN|nr:hypothetical protein FE257_005421 [Aspergillus nanangensis]
MKGLQTGISMAVLAAVARAQVTGVDGNGGVDTGNAASADFSNTHNTGIKNGHKDNHSGHFNSETNVGPPHWPVRRFGPGVTNIDGNGGVDTGNAASADFSNKHDTGIANGYKDNHSGHFNSDTNIFKRGGVTNIDGNGGADVGGAVKLGGKHDVNTQITNDYKDNHSGHFNSETNVRPALGFPIRRQVTGIDGNGGADVGNAADVGSNQAVNTGITNDAEDNHSGHFNSETNFGRRFARNFPFENTGIGGNGAVDVGNSASGDFSQEHNTGVKNGFEDNHSLSSNVETNANPVPYVPFAKRDRDLFPEIPSRPVDTGIGGNHATDVGNSADLGSPQEVNTGITNKHDDDHSVTVNSETDIKRAFRPTSPQEPEMPMMPQEPQVPQMPQQPQMPQPEPSIEHGANTADAACATETRQVVHTITQTIYAQPSTPAAPMMVPSPSSSAVASPSSSAALHGIMTSTMTVSKASVHMIPVSVPTSSSSAAVSSSHVAMASSSAAVPTGVDAMRPSSTPSASSPAGVLFQGGAAHLTPNAGVLTAFCGVMGLLAFVL